MPGRRAFWLAQSGVWISYGGISCLALLPSGGAEAVGNAFLFKGLIRPLTGLLVSTGLAILYRSLGTRTAGSTMAWVAAASVVGGSLWFLAARGLLFPFMAPGTEFWVGGRFPHFALEYVFVLLAWSGGFVWLAETARANQGARDAATALAARRTAELDALAYQLNPHLLFNALTSLRGLIRRSPERAERMTTRLAALLRHTLNQPGQGATTLAAELEAVEAYVDIERLRFERGIDLQVDLSPGAGEWKVPALILYPLVENAIKHGRSEPDPVRIDIVGRTREGRLTVEVVNRGTLANGGSRDADRPRPRLGLRNVRERLALLHPGGGRLDLANDDGLVRAIIEIPEGGAE